MSDKAGNWRFISLGGAGGMFVGMGLGRFSYTAMVAALIAQGKLDVVAAGYVGAANLAGFLLGALASLQFARLVPRVRLLKIAVLVGLAGLGASALSNEFWWLAGWRGIIGVTTAVIMVHGLAITTESAPAERRPLATGIFFAGVGFSIVCSGLLVPALLGYGLVACWWGLFAIGCIGAALALWGWCYAPTDPVNAAGNSGFQWPSVALLVLAAAHFLFSFGLVPHTLYWVDFIARDLAFGPTMGGFHWSLVGAFAVAGPFVAARLAGKVGTARALLVAFVVLGLGILAPWLFSSLAILFLSTIIFGGQPGVSTLMAARARDLGTLGRMSSVMRLMILSSGLGGVFGGYIVPGVYGGIGHQATFLVGGLAMLIAGVALAATTRRAAG